MEINRLLSLHTVAGNNDTDLVRTGCLEGTQEYLYCGC